jgi:PAS domain S-box-containing protein
VDRFLVGKENMGSLVSAPLVSNRGVLGVLVYGFKGPSRLHPQDLQAITTVARLLAVAIDHAELYQASQRRQAELNAIINAVSDGLIVYDARNRAVRVNAPAAEILGLPAEEITALPFESWVGAQRVETSEGAPLSSAQTPAARALQGELVTEVHLVVHTPNGQLRHVLQSAGPIRDERGEIDGVVASLHDITAQTLAEQDRKKLLEKAQVANERIVKNTLRERELSDEVKRHAHELNVIIENMPNGVIIFDRESKVSMVNKVGLSLLGMEKEEILGQQAMDIEARLKTETVDQKPVTVEISPIARAFKGGTVKGFHSILHLPNNRTMHAMFNAAPIQAQQERIVGVIFTFADITALIELQQLQQDAGFVVAHDLRQPLTAILGNAQVTERSLDKERIDSAKLSTKAIITSAQRMNIMLQDLVDSSRVDINRLELDCHPIDLGNYLDELLKRNATSLDVDRIKVSIQRNMPQVSADANRLERIFLNLLTNALKYSDPNTPVNVRVKKDGEYALIGVQDYGRGIATEDLHHLFERFYRTKGPHKKESVGLGLYITRMLVQAHQGRIWVKSQEGKGSTFSFTLPLA